MEVPFCLTRRGADHSVVPALSNYRDCVSYFPPQTPPLGRRKAASRVSVANNEPAIILVDKTLPGYCRSEEG
jgi:hypothetical protein